MKKYLIKCFSLILLASPLITSCGDESEEVVGPIVFITYVYYVLTPNAGGDAIILSFNDPDGEGGNAPTITGGTLQSNTTYTGQIVLGTPDEDNTPEIIVEDVEHQFFYAASGANISVQYADMDADGNPIGLATTLTTTDASSGNLTITLRHNLDKAGIGVADGDISNAGGDTDMEVTFDINIQ
ncbi:MAG: type 1 periplasmic binding fold superfamily protein [Bacteroidota bacterium]